MNSYQRVEAVISGKIPDRVPVCLLNYICACRESGYTIGECFRDAKKLSYSLIKAQKKYGHDMIHFQNGVYGIAQSLGCKVKYFDTTCPVVTERPYNDYEEFIDKYTSFEPDELTTVLIQVTELLSAEFGDHVCIRPELGQGPFSLAGIVFGLDKFLIDVIDENKIPIIKKVLRIFNDILIKLAKEFKREGAHVMGIGDSFLSPDVVSPMKYKDFGYPYHKYLVDELKKIGFNLIIHICGNATDIVKELTDTGVAAIELDHKVNSELCRDITSGKCTIIGNIDPSEVLCLGNPNLIRSKVEEAINIFGKKGFFILGSGCDMSYETPEENIYAMVDAAKKFGKY